LKIRRKKIFEEKNACRWWKVNENWKAIFVKVYICLINVTVKLTIISTQCAKDCGPRKPTCGCDCARDMHGAMFASPSRFLKIVYSAFFWIFACEESCLQMKHAKKNYMNFLTTKTTILTHGRHRHVLRFQKLFSSIILRLHLPWCPISNVACDLYKLVLIS
jgi:hypothetical protein